MSVFHVNSSSTENILDSFAAFIEDVVRDQAENRRAEEGLIDEMWDESIKVRTRQHMMVGKDASTKTSTTMNNGRVMQRNSS